jgi:superfamily II DNA or RNA helicase
MEKFKRILNSLEEELNSAQTMDHLKDVAKMLKTTYRQMKEEIEDINIQNDLFYKFQSLHQNIKKRVVEAQAEAQAEAQKKRQRPPSPKGQKPPTPKKIRKKKQCKNLSREECEKNRYYPDCCYYWDDVKGCVRIKEESCKHRPVVVIETEDPKFIPKVVLKTDVCEELEDEMQCNAHTTMPFCCEWSVGKCKKMENLKDCQIGKCLPGNVTLRDHQIRVVQHMLKHRGLLAVHSVGSGKTLLAGTAAQCVLEAFRKQDRYIRIVFVSPKGLDINFKSQMREAFTSINFMNYKFYTYQSFVNAYNSGKERCEHTFLIIDEAHNLRTQPKGEEGKRARVLIECAKKASRVLLLTATPVINRPKDIINLITMIDGQKMSEHAFNRDIKDKQSDDEDVKKYFQCKVSYYKFTNPQVRGEESDYPTSEIHRVEIPMSQEYYENYLNIQKGELTGHQQILFGETKNLTIFFNGIRRAANTFMGVSNPKLEWIKNRLLLGKKTIVFSQFVELGVEQVARICIELRIPFEKITGDTKKEKRDEVIKLYNKNRIKVVIISKAGGEGSNYKGTQDVILMQPGWNEAELEQAMGRAIRYKSHAHIEDPMERHVDIWKLILTKPLLRKPNDKNLDSADVEMEKISQKKNREINEFMSKIIDNSIERNPC